MYCEVPMKLKVLLLSALCTIFCVQTALARTVSVDLRSALRDAVTQRPAARAAREQAQASRHAAGVAKGYYLPRVTAAENFAITDEPGNSMFITLNQEKLNLSDPNLDLNHPDTTKDFETKLSLEQPLYNPDISYGYHRAQKGAEAAAASARWSEEQIAFGAYAAYLRLQQAHAALGSAQASHKSALEMLRVASERHRAGLGLKADELRTKVFLAQTERRLVTVRNDLTIARQRFALALGRPGADLDIAAPLTPALFRDKPVAGTLKRADLQALELQSQAADLAYRQSKAAYLPRVGLQASYSLHDSSAPFGTEGKSYTVGVGLTWDLFDGRRRAEGKARAAALKRAIDDRRLDAVQEATLKVHEARLRAGEARLNLATAREAVKEASEGHRLTLERYRAGLASLSDLLGTQSALDQARLDAVRAEAGLLMALGNIRYQDGTFLKTFLPDEVNP
jgi:outer membrane protein